MTEQEYNRFEKAKEIRDEIEKEEADLNALNYKFDSEHYPRSERGWGIGVFINDEYKSESLTSEEFWWCVNIIKECREKRIEKLKEEFKKL